MMFFSLWVQAENGQPVAKILERRPLPPYVGWMGFPRNQLAGVSRFSEAVFRREFPFANLKFEDEGVPFYLTWVFPNRENYWNRGNYWEEEEVDGRKFKNHYAGRFQDAREAAEYLIANIRDLTADTRRFHDLLFNSAYPSSVINAVSSKASSLQTNLVLRTEDGGGGSDLKALPTTAAAAP